MVFGKSQDAIHNENCYSSSPRHTYIHLESRKTEMNAKMHKMKKNLEMKYFYSCVHKNSVTFLNFKNV